MRGLAEAYRALSAVYREKSWIGEAIAAQGAVLYENKGAFRLVYGVVEHEYLYEYRIARLVAQSPKLAVKILLKMGMYLLEESKLPSHAAVSEIVDTAKNVGKGGVAGFLNAVLRRYDGEGRDILPTDPDELLSVRANLPVWLVRRYERELGDGAAARLTAPRTAKTHVRGAFSYGKEALLAELTKRSIDYEETKYGAFLREVGTISDLLAEGKATVMSYGSAEVADAVPYAGGEILDLCAAPGGKSVYLSEKYDAPVLACDVYEHRVDLIRKYASRMGARQVKAILSDGTKARGEWRERFPVVLLDAPCSGLGSLASNPDVALNRTERDLDEILALQDRLIAVAGEYVAAGGCLVYATCSDLPSEDHDVVSAFLRKTAGFAVEKERYTDPAEGGGESYYYAILRKQ